MAASLDDDSRPCTIEELEKIITAPSGGFTMLPSSAYDEVFDGIFVGEGDSARSVNCMKRLGITHVLNAALGKDQFHVNTNHVMYRKAGIHFLGIEATDFMNYNLAKHFDAAAEFIDGAVNNRGKVFVHCVQGVSRSATLVIAFLMLKRHMTVQSALRLVRSKREVCPNPGFLQQLCDLHEKLKVKGHYNTTLSEQSLEALKRVNTGNNCQSDWNNCTVEDIESILTAPTEGYVRMPEAVYSQIDRNIFIGEGDFALNIDNLKRLQITHVLNAAQWKGINSLPQTYTDAGLQFLGVTSADRPDAKLSKHFCTAADFIDAAVTSNGKVYVHCVKGFSRSPALVMAYYMIKCSLPLPEAAKRVRQHREVCPNTGFLEQLCHLHNRLAAERQTGRDDDS